MVSRREFLKFTGAAAGTAAVALAGVERAQARPALDPDRVGVLCDFTLCVGCRRCEYACAESNGLPHGPLESYDDKTVLERMRRPDRESLTVINRYPALEGQPKPMDVKVNCLHCEHPACASACPVSALQKNPLGPVTYDPWRCIGCRYCMVACPFQVPAYEYREPLKPRVMKCTMCAERTMKEGLPPACVQICPQEALLYGARDALLSVAHDRIRTHPGRYVDHVYGETECGGTSWLYMCDRSFLDVDLPTVTDQSPAEVTEHIQHGIFRGFTGPLMVFALVSVIMKSAGRAPGSQETHGHGEDDHD